jgi:hypothetical protein
MDNPSDRHHPSQNPARGKPVQRAIMTPMPWGAGLAAGLLVCLQAWALDPAVPAGNPSDGAAVPTAAAAAGDANGRPSVRISGLWGMAVGLEALARQHFGRLRLDEHVSVSVVAPLLGSVDGFPAVVRPTPPPELPLPTPEPVPAPTSGAFQTTAAVPVAIPFAPLLAGLMYAKWLADIGVTASYPWDLAPGWRLRPSLGLSLARTGDISFSPSGEAIGLMPRYACTVEWQPADGIRVEGQIEARHAFGITPILTGSQYTAAPALGLFPGARLDVHLAEASFGIGFRGAPTFQSGGWYPLVDLHYGRTWWF